MSESEDDLVKAVDWRTSEILGPVVNNVYSRSPVNCLQIREDRVLVGFADSTVRLFDRGTGIRLWTLEGHSGPVNCLHSNKTRMVTGSDDKAIRLWDLRDGSCSLTLEGHVAPVLCVRITDRQILSGARDHLIKVWDRATGQCVRTLRGHTGRVCDLQMAVGSPTHFLTSSTDGTVKLWDVRTDSRQRSFKGHKKAITCFSVSATEMVSASADTHINIWDIGTGKCMQTLRVPTEAEIPTSIVLGDSLLFCGEASGLIRICDAVSGTPVRLLEGHAAPVSALEVHPTEIWSGSLDSTVRRWGSKDDVAVLLARMRRAEFEIPEQTPEQPGGWPASLSSSAVIASEDLQRERSAERNAERAAAALRPSTGVPSRTVSNLGSLPLTPHRLNNSGPGASITQLAPTTPGGGSNSGPSSPGAVAGASATLLPPSASVSGVHLSTSAVRMDPTALAGTTVENSWARGAVAHRVLYESMAALNSCDTDHELVVCALREGLVVAIAVGTGAAAGELASLSSPAVCVAVRSGRALLGCSDGTVALWTVSAPSGSRDGVIQSRVHEGSVTAVSLHDELTVSAAADGSIVLTWLASGEAHSRVRGEGAVLCLHCDAPRRLLITGGEDTNLYVWTLAPAFECIHVLRGHRGPITAVVFDDLEVFSASADQTIKCWEADGAVGRAQSSADVSASGAVSTTGATVGCARTFVLEGEPQPAGAVGDSATVTALRFDDYKIVCGQKNGIVAIRDIETGEAVRMLRAHQGSVVSMHYTGNSLITASRDGTCVLLSFGDAPASGVHPLANANSSGSLLDGGVAGGGGGGGRIVRDPHEADSMLSGEALPPHGGPLGLLRRHEAARGYDLATAPCRVWTVNRGKTAPVLSLQYDERFVFAGGADSVVKMWDLETRTRARTFRGHTGPVHALALVGETMVTASEDQTARLWNVASQSSVFTLSRHEKAVLSCCLTRTHALTGSRDHTIMVWDLTTGKHVRTLRGHLGRVTALRADEKGSLYSASTDGTLKQWSTSDESRIRSFKGHTGLISGIAVDGGELVSCAADLSIRRWSLGSGQPVCIIDAHESSHEAKCVAMDGSLIVAGCVDGAVRLYDRDSGDLRRTIEVAGSQINSIQFDGCKIVAGSDDKTVRIVDFSSEGRPRSCVLQ